MPANWKIKPYWAPDAHLVLEPYLKDKVVFEWGNGCSTPWIAQRCQFLFAVDHDINWTNRAKTLCREAQLRNIDFSVYPEHDSRYFETIYWFSEMQPIDIVIVDGVNRMRCFEFAWRYVKPGGLIVLDDSQRDEYKHAFGYGLEIIHEVKNHQNTTFFRKA